VTRFAAPVPARFGRAAATFVVMLLAAMPWASAQPVAVVESPTFTVVAERARALAAQPYVAPAGKLPADLAALNYDRHRDIRFRPERALWRDAGLPFEVQFFHPGWLFADPVRVHEVTGEGTREISVDPRDFDYGKNTLDPAAWPKLGFAGFRVHYPLNNAAYKDELVVFLGASYFRALGKGQRYGLSARALAIDTVARPGKPTRGEEFPRFVEFWLERPADAQATSLTLHALLDSPRAAGAYTFTITPGEDTVMQVRSRLYLRAGSEDIATLGIAPLTSMFLHGENQPDDDDFRPEVHDSDGLAVHAGSGEWLWRPLVNPQLSRAKGVLTTSFSTTDPRGFGLMQRDRAFSSYEDLEARYELRPSAWVEPIGAWGAGRVELVQLPTDEEIHDNIVAYWLPEKLPAPGEPLDLELSRAVAAEAGQAPRQRLGDPDAARPQLRQVARWRAQVRHRFRRPRAARAAARRGGRAGGHRGRRHRGARGGGLSARRHRRLAPDAARAAADHIARRSRAARAARLSAPAHRRRGCRGTRCCARAAHRTNRGRAGRAARADPHRRTPLRDPERNMDPVAPRPVTDLQPDDVRDLHDARLRRIADDLAQERAEALRDRQARDAARSTPPLARGTMAAQPWRAQPVRGLIHALLGRDAGPRETVRRGARLAGDGPASPRRAGAPDSRVGARRGPRAVVGLAGRADERAACGRAGSVRAAVRLDRRRLLDRGGRLRGAAARRRSARADARHRPARADLAAGAHRDRDAGMQRARTHRVRRPARHDGVAQRHRRRPPVRLPRAVRHAPGRPAGAGSDGLARPARAAGRDQSLLPLAWPQVEEEGRQRRRLLPPLRPRLPLHGGARCRQRDERRLPAGAGADDGGTS
jgi:periplasmic glucans biosynthesis protein